MKVVLGNRTWTIRTLPASQMDQREPELLGECTTPVARQPVIVIRRGLPQKERLDVLIHEALHACRWYASEAWVNKTATQIAALLWRDGWRRN